MVVRYNDKFIDHYNTNNSNGGVPSKHKATKDVQEEQMKSKGFVFPRPLPHYIKENYS